MEFFRVLGRGLLFALACNLDTVLASVGHGARRKGLRWAEAGLVKKSDLFSR